MKNDIKEKLLQVIGDFSGDDLSANRLIDVLADKLKDQNEEIERLKRKNSVREAQLCELEELARRKYQSLMSNPSKSWESAYPMHFIDEKGVVFEVIVKFGDVEVRRWERHMQTMLMHISPAEAEARR